MQTTNGKYAHLSAAVKAQSQSQPSTVNTTIKHFPPASPGADPQTTGELVNLRTQMYKLLDRIDALETKVSTMASAPLTAAQLQQVSQALSIAGGDGKTRLNLTGLLGS